MTRPRQTVTHVPIDRLLAHPGNIRHDLGDLTEMAHSIREHGILQPLTATEHPTQPDRLILLAGHRRLRGALLAKETHVPVIIRHGLDDAAEQLVVMLVENTHRRDLNPVERAQAYGALRNRGLTLTEIARRTGAQASVVSYYLNLLDLDQPTLEAVRVGEVASTDAIAAVRDARQRQREANGQARRGRKRNLPYFGRQHALAARVRAICVHRDRPLVGEVGCGQCWEQAIRDDALGIADFVTPPRSKSEPAVPDLPKPEPRHRYEVDEVVVQRVIDGDRSLSMTRGERLEVVRRLHARGLSDGAIAAAISKSSDQVFRDRIDLGLPAAVDAAGNPIRDGAA